MQVQHAEPGPGYAQQQMMMPMPHQASYQHPPAHVMGQV